MTMHTLESVNGYSAKKANEIMTDEIEWITLSQAEERPECRVSRQTLHAMIERGEIPQSAIQTRPYGKEREITYIDASILKSLDYRKPGQRGKAKE